MIKETHLLEHSIEQYANIPIKEKTIWQSMEDKASMTL